MISIDPTNLSAQSQEEKRAPVESWEPPFSGEMDLRIARDGTWWHEGTPIRRESMIRLFSTILRKDKDGLYYLLTPFEKWRIQVDDAPFLAVFLTIENALGARQHWKLRFQTNVGDVVTAGVDHPIRMIYDVHRGEALPYVHIRARLWALISRPTFLELAELAVEQKINGERFFGVWSDGQFFQLERIEAQMDAP